jgi:hypothetical protein
MACAPLDVMDGREVVLHAPFPAALSAASVGANATTRHGQPGCCRWCRFYSVVVATYSVADYVLLTRTIGIFDG